MRRLILSTLLAAPFTLQLSAASIDGFTIHSSTAGSGKKTLIFIHGWTCDSSSWDAQVPELSKKYRVITLDLPGHGQSGSPADGKFSMDLFARAVEAVRQEAKADKIVLIGHSMGAPVIRQYARLYPQHVAALVAVDGPLDMRQFGPGQRAGGPSLPPMTGPEGVRTRETMIRSMFTPQTPPALQQHITTMMMKAPEATAAGAMAAMFDPAIRTEDVTPVPALAIYAGTARLPDIGEMKQVLPQIATVTIPGTGHFVMLENPYEFNRILTAYLAKRIKF
jgi:pimeloyl-ACP methyl ester carboxylesterase